MLLFFRDKVELLDTQMDKYTLNTFIKKLDIFLIRIKNVIHDTKHTQKFDCFEGDLFKLFTYGVLAWMVNMKHLMEF